MNKNKHIANDYSNLKNRVKIETHPDEVDKNVTDLYNIQIYVKEEPYDGETVLDGVIHSGATKQYDKEEINLHTQIKLYNVEKVELCGIPNVEVNCGDDDRSNEENPLENFVKDEPNGGVEAGDGNNDILMNTTDEASYDYDDIHKLGRNGNSGESNEEKNSVEISVESYRLNKKEVDDDYEDIHNSRNNKSTSRSKSDDENSLLNFIKEQDFHIDNVDLIEDINNERNESGDEGNSITSSFAKEVLEDDIEMNKQTHLAKNPSRCKKANLPRHCEKCNKTFRRPGRLRKHLEVHKKKQSQLYKCKTCPGVFKGEHVHEHKTYRIRPEEVDGIVPIKDEKKFECTMCNKKFARRIFLNDHLQIHLNIKNFSCDQCSKTFYSKSSLQRHMHKHTGVKCRFCNEMFKAGHVLETHERTHTGEKPFICELCGRGFALLFGFQCHLRRHKEEKPFQCDICGKKFYTNSHFRAHSKKHR